jgi:hypothetical protein
MKTNLQEVGRGREWIDLAQESIKCGDFLLAEDLLASHKELSSMVLASESTGRN